MVRNQLSRPLGTVPKTSNTDEDEVQVEKGTSYPHWSRTIGVLKMVTLGHLKVPQRNGGRLASTGRKDIFITNLSLNGTNYPKRKGGR